MMGGWDKDLPKIPSVVPESTLQLAWNRWKMAVPDVSRSDYFAAQASKIMTNRPTYILVGQSLGIPWYVIGVIHMRESNFNFETFLANGDPLPGPTTHIPKGLGPCRNWGEAAELSLKNQGWNNGMAWDLAHTLLNLEAYNGMGYSRKGLPSPYVWSGTSVYTKGKYTSDGIYDPTAVDNQPGCAPVMMALRGAGVNLNEVIVT